jgi:hypothetical protein
MCKQKESTTQEIKPNKNTIDKSSNIEQENKKDHKQDYNKDEIKRLVKDKNIKVKRFSLLKEDLNGIRTELIQEHKAANATC